MKLIIATIERSKLNNVMAALASSGVSSIIACEEIKFTGLHSGRRESLLRDWDEIVDRPEWVSKDELKIVVPDGEADDVIEKINSAANIQRTDKIGEGEIFMLSD